MKRRVAIYFQLPAVNSHKNIERSDIHPLGVGVAGVPFCDSLYRQTEKKCKKWTTTLPSIRNERHHSLANLLCWESSLHKTDTRTLY